MQTLLLPTDFSATAKNAGLYALKLAAQLGASKLVLYHSYEIPVTIDPMVPGIQMLEVDSLKDSSQEGLNSFRSELLPFAQNIIIENFNEYGDLAEGLDDACKKVKADLVVMGITGGGALEETLVGSNALTVAKHTRIPVIIVPADVSFSPVRGIVLTHDFDADDTPLPLEPIRKIVQETQATLYVLTITDEPEEYEEDNDDDDSDTRTLKTLLQDLQPEYHTLESDGFAAGVNKFTADHQADLVITVARKQGFFSGLFSGDHTKKLAFHSKVPVMVLQGNTQK